MKKGKRWPERYRWVVVAASFLVFATTVGLGYNCWSVLTIPVCEDLRLTRQQFSGLFTALLVGQMLGALTTDKLLGRMGMMPFMRVGTIATAVTLMLSSQIQTVGQLYLAGVLIGFFLSATCFLPFSILVASWFVRFRGIITGLVFMSSGLGSMVMIPIVNRWTMELGWRKTVCLMALIMVVIAVPQVLFVLRATPEEVGLLPYGEELTEIRLQATEDAWGMPLEELLRQPSFWLFLLFTLGIYLETMLSNTTVPYLIDEGFHPDDAARVQSLCMGVLAVLRLTAGRLCDRMGAVRATALFTVLTPLLAIGLLAAPVFPAAIALLVLGQGIGESETTVCYPMIVGWLFGRKHFAQVYGVITAFAYLVGAVAPLLFGWIYSIAGSYRPAYWIFGGTYVVGAGCLWWAIQVRESTFRKSEGKI